MNLERPSDLAAVLTTIVAFGSLATDTAFGTQLTTIFGAWTPKILASITLLSGVAAILLRVQSNPSPPPGQQHVTEPVPAPAPAAPAPQNGPATP
jgi:hypothetical protein